MSERREIDDWRAASLREARKRAEAFSYLHARRALLSWFDAHGRRFPWRDEPTPYRVWISEIMLQQTTTQTALGYFERFLSRFPTPEELANATEEEVLSLWEGLGYYRRARALRNAAIVMKERFNSRAPETYEDVLALPGVGRYCAGAIMSFGFDRRYPILEANTRRLHARTLALDVDPTQSEAEELLWQVAEKWLPRESSKRPANLYRKLNGALTDLGRLVCQPGVPKCDECPISRYCHARMLGVQESIPVLKKKDKPLPRTDVSFWISRRDLPTSNVLAAPDRPELPTDVLLMRQPPWALWAGLWDFPRLEVVDPAFQKGQAWRRDPELADRLALFLETEVGAPAKRYWPGPALKVFRHSVTRYRITLSLCRLQDAAPTNGSVMPPTLFDELEPEPRVTPSVPERLAPSAATLRLEGKPLSLEWRWVPIADLKNYPLSSPGRKIATFIEERLRKEE